MTSHDGRPTKPPEDFPQAPSDPAAAEQAAGRSGEATSREGEQPSHLRAAAVYGTMILGGLLVLQFILRIGRGISGPKPKGAEIPGAGGGGSTEHVLWKLLLAAAVIIVVARVAG